jgi:hypothetical protein
MVENISPNCKYFNLISGQDLQEQNSRHIQHHSVCRKCLTLKLEALVVLIRTGISSVADKDDISDSQINQSPNLYKKEMQNRHR